MKPLPTAFALRYPFPKTTSDASCSIVPEQHRQMARGQGMCRVVRARAFSLVEVVLALGIAAVGLLSLFSLLPLGLQTFRKAIDTTVQAQIIQYMMNEAGQTSYARLPLLGNAPYYFDDEGQRVPDANSAIYTTTVKVVGSTTLPPGGSTVSSNITTMTLEIKNIAFPNAKDIKKYAAYLSNTTGG